MAKWRIKYELRDYIERIVKANSAEEAEDIVCIDSYKRHGQDIYDIWYIEPVKEEPNK